MEQQLETALHVIECYHKHTNDLITRFKQDGPNGADIIVTSDPEQKRRLREFLQDEFPEAARRRIDRL